MSIGLYINFNGNCREAVEYYAGIFNTEKPKFMTFGDVPPNPEFPQRDEIKNLVMHTQLQISESTIMFSDVPPEVPFQPGNNISLVINCGSMEETRRLFDQLKIGGEIEMELQETFWSKCYGYVQDKYGIWWQLFYGGE
jgi:PhnB protein